VIRAQGAVALALALAWISPSPSLSRARAQGRPRIVVLDSTGGGTLGQRIRAELGTIGFDPKLVTVARADEPSGDLDAIARREDAIAAVQVVSAGGACKVAVFDRATGKSLRRELDPAPESQEPTLAIGVVELLRAMLLELALPEVGRKDLQPPLPVPPETVPPTPAPSSTVTTAKQPPSVRTPAAPAPSLSPRHPKAAAEIGLGAMASPGGLPQLMALAVSAGFFVGPAIRVGAFGLVPLGSMRHEAAEGTSENRVTIVGADLRGELFGGPWQASLGGGIAAARLSTQGRSRSLLYRDQSATRTTGSAYLRPGAVYRFTRELVVRAETTIGVLAHPFAIQYAGREAARWGAFWFAGWIGIEARFP
jgi:hypothetical protein